MMPPNTSLRTQLKNFYLFKNVDENILEILSTKVSCKVVPIGETLFSQGTVSDALYFVINGQLQVTIDNEDGSQTILGKIGINETVGEMQILVGGKRTADVSAITKTELIRLSKADFEQIVDLCPDVLRKLAKVTVKRLRRAQLLTTLPKLFGVCDPNIFEKIEKQIEWVYLHSGDALFLQGELGNSLYIVVSGRLEAVVEDNMGKTQIVGEISRGETVGEMAIFSEELRAASVYALRDCELVKLPKVTFEQIMQQRPHMMMAITKVIIQRLQKAMHAPVTQSNLINIAVVPISPNVKLNGFCQRLVSTLLSSDSILHLSSERVDNLMEMMGASQLAEDDPQSIRLSTLLDEQEIKHHFTLYQADSTVTNWTQWCLKRADQIILVANATDDPQLSEIEQILLCKENCLTTASQMLVLLHSKKEKLPSGTQRWLSPRKVKSHHHVRCHVEADFERLTRFLTGRAVGLVLSGGGARGFAHFGVYLALKEAGIPIDMIGGSSMGGHIGAQCAAEWNRRKMIRVNRRGLVDFNPYKAYQLPIVSLLRGQKMKESSTMAFGETQIEDLWINFFCISSNLSTYQMNIHQQGSLEKAIRATTAIPGIAEPILEDGNVLIDGGVLNNLPGDIMRRYCGTVIVIDIAGQMNLNVEYESIPSAWEILWRRIWPFQKSFQLPSIIDILLGATLLSSNDRANMVRKDADFCLTPPVKQFKMLEFSALEELVEVGYQYTKEEIKNWPTINAEKWEELEPWIEEKTKN